MNPLYLGIAAIVVVLIGANVPWGTVAGWFKGSTGSGTDEDSLDVAALKRLQARFKRLNCPEGTAAMQTVGTHFFHEGA